MANISFRFPSTIDDDECRTWMLAAMDKGKPGPEFQSIRAHAPGVMRSFTKTREWIYHDGVLEFALKELLRAYIALAGDCTYCGGQGTAKGIRDDRSQLDELLDYERSNRYSQREKAALRYADAIMWNPELADETMWKELHDIFTEPELVELGYWIGFTFGGQRWLKTLGSSQGQLQAAMEESGERGVVAGHNPHGD